MSRTTIRGRARLVLTSLFAVAIMAFAIISLMPKTGADLEASGTGRIDASTATLTLGLTDGKQTAGSFDLDYVNLAPGDSQSQTIVVSNTGSIPADVSFGGPLSDTILTGGNLTPSDYAELKISVPGHQTPVGIDQLPQAINLGSLNPGETKSYELTLSLDRSAGNEWQGVTLGATATVTLKQQR